MKNIENFDVSKIPFYKILFAVTSEPDYEMDRILILEDYPNYDEYTVINGGHCSCFDFDETNWDATMYTDEEMDILMRSWSEKGCGTEQAIARLWRDQNRLWDKKQ
jgi:hypothetical protein